jgi:hypothetical protein
MISQEITKDKSSQEKFRNYLPGFFVEHSTKSEESVWQLRHIAALCDMNWRDIAENDLFKKAADDCCLTALEDEGREDVKAFKNPQDAYLVLVSS